MSYFKNPLQDIFLQPFLSFHFPFFISLTMEQLWQTEWRKLKISDTRIWQLWQIFLIGSFFLLFFIIFDIFLYYCIIQTG